MLRYEAERQARPVHLLPLRQAARPVRLPSWWPREREVQLQKRSSALRPAGLQWIQLMARQLRERISAGLERPARECLAALLEVSPL